MKRTLCYIAVLTLVSFCAAQEASAKAFVHGIVIEVDGEDYYMAGAPDGPSGATDIPGHYWTQAGKKQFNYFLFLINGTNDCKSW